MARGEPYTPCRLFYDGRAIEPGEYLKTPAGSAYLIQAVRRSPTRPQRRYLDCLRWPAKEIPAGAVVHPLYWYKRKARSGRRLKGVAPC